MLILLHILSSLNNYYYTYHTLSNSTAAQADDKSCAFNLYLEAMLEQQQIGLGHTVVPNVENPPKNKFPPSDFTSFSMQVSANSYNVRFR